MERRGNNTWVIAVLAIAVGFLAALLIVNSGDDNKNASATSSATTTATTTTGTGTDSGTTTSGTITTTTSTQQAAPQDPIPSVGSCVDLWNSGNNRPNQTFLVNIMAQQPVRVHVGVTSDVPPQCLVTVTANNGRAYVFPEGGGNTFPYAATPGGTDAASLPAAQKTSNALEQRDGTLQAR